MSADRNLKFERANNTLVFTRQFDASAAQVFRTHTEPKLIAKWLLGPPGWTMPICEFDSQTGGKYRYGWAHPEEQGFSIGGTILDIQRDQRIVHTELFEGTDMGGESVVVMLLSEDSSVTTMSMSVIYQDADTVEKVLATGMTGGMEQSYGNLDKVLAN